MTVAVPQPCLTPPPKARDPEDDAVGAQPSGSPPWLIDIVRSVIPLPQRARRITYAYDADGRRISETDANRNTTSDAYNAPSASGRASPTRSGT
jgi:hypothetical protein